MMRLHPLDSSMTHPTCPTPTPTGPGRARWLLQALCCLFAGHAAAQSLCRTDEEVFFSCRIERSEKTASVCGVAVDGQLTRLQYRFGTPRHLELTYPPAVKGSVTHFQLEHVNSNDGKGGGQFYNELFFRSGTFYYAVLSGKHSREDGRFEGDRQISVFDADPWLSSPLRTLTCAPSGAVDHLPRLYDLIGDGEQILPRH